MNVNNPMITKTRLNKIRDERMKKREAAYKECVPVIGGEAVDELKALMDIYDENLYIWLAGLWDPSIGGFYFSNSARDTDGFLPDIESTEQATRFLETCEITSGYDLPKKIGNAIFCFTQSLQDPEDGYFYHPQWGKDIKTSRKGRDLGWGITLTKRFGGELRYPTALDRLASEKKSEVMPEHLRSINSFKKYLAELDMNRADLGFTHTSYWTGNLLQSQAIQIKAAGEEFVKTLFFWLAEHRKPNGLWEDQINYASVNGLMKIMLLYNQLELCLPNHMNSLNSALQAALSDENIRFVCEFYNPWVAMNGIINNKYRYGDREQSIEMREMIVAKAPELIKVTSQKIQKHKKEDGSFSYYADRATWGSQGAYVAMPNTNEGDVSSSTISSTGMARNICLVLGIPTIPMFANGDRELFFELIENAKPIEKINPKPDFLSRYDKK